MCFLAGTCGPDSRRAVFFIDTSGCQLHYQKLVSSFCFSFSVCTAIHRF
jgi:hypothetical protein